MPTDPHRPRSEDRPRIASIARTASEDLAPIIIGVLALLALVGLGLVGRATMPAYGAEALPSESDTAMAETTAARTAIGETADATADGDRVAAGPEAVLRLSEAFRSIASRLEPSVVRIVAISDDRQATGSGFVIREDGYVVTNNHVVREADRVIVEFTSGRRLRGRIVGTDPLTDLAVLSVRSRDLEAASFGADERLEVGDWVVAIGCPLGLEPSVTAGIVSAKNRRLGILGARRTAGYEDFIQTDAAINQGNSGGPLVNLGGEVVGVNTAILTQNGGSDGIGFAIPSRLASFVVDELIEHGRVRRGFLGVNIQDVDPALARSYDLPETQRGVLVTRVINGSAADRAGLRVEDVIVELDGRTVETVSQLRQTVAMIRPDTWVAVEVLRDGKSRTMRAMLQEMDDGGAGRVELASMVEPPDPERPLGLEIGTWEGRPVIREVVDGSPADLAGIESGHAVTEIDGRPVDALLRGDDADDDVAAWLVRRLSGLESGDVVRLRLERGPRVWFRAVEVP